MLATTKNKQLVGFRLANLGIHFVASGNIGFFDWQTHFVIFRNMGFLNKVQYLHEQIHISLLVFFFWTKDLFSS